ncbi:MAG: response regulator [Thermodesulfovibrionales bacterium]
MKEKEIKIDDKPHIKVLIIEDDEGHAGLICTYLSKAEKIYFDTERAARLSAAMDLLEKKNFDVILSDLGLPDSAGLETFIKLHNRYPAVPVIVLTGLVDENTALSAMHSGAQDYLVKGEIFTRQLTHSIRYAIERQKLITELEEKRKEIKTLRGLLPMCAWCRNIRDDKGYWKSLETYIQESTDADFSHGICPKCMKKTNPDLYEKIKREDPDFGEQEDKKADQ